MEKKFGDLLARCPSFGYAGSAAYKPGLERMEAMCARMGNPERGLRCVHVAGTNGKGSTCNFLCASLASMGFRVGLYTSPHIYDVRERIRIVSGGSYELIPPDALDEFACLYRDDAVSLGLSYFEIVTSAAFWYFSREKVDWVVLETGLGGRLDATNVVVPALSVITNIGYDHMDVLGNTLPLIAQEKAGIIKPGVPVVVGESDQETVAVFREVALRRGSPLFFADSCAPEVALPPDMDLKGCYQPKNLRTVLCALERLGFAPDWDALSRAASVCGFHGRWEKVCDNPLTICDIGHNAHGLKYNFAQLSSMLDRGECSDVVMVYGSVADKDVDAVLRLLPSRAYIFFTAASSPRALPAEELFSRALSLRCDDSAFGGRWRCVPEVPDALAAARKLCLSLEKPLLYVGGSTYVISECRFI